MTHQGIGQSSRAVAQLVQGLVKFLLLLLNIHVVSSRLSRMKKTAMRASPFYTFFSGEAAHPAGTKKKRFAGDFFLKKSRAPIWMRKVDFVSYRRILSKSE